MRAHTLAPLLAWSVVVLSGLGLAGCTHTETYTVQVDAISQSPATGQPGPAPQSYHIRSHNSAIDEDSLRYKEVADYVRTALSSKGMYEAPTPEKADVVIDIDYGMEAPRIKFETINQPIMVQQPGRYVTERRPVTRRMADGTFQTVEVDTKVFVPGGVEFRGMQEIVQPVLVYEKYLKLAARENREAAEGRPAPEVWSVNVSTEDDSQELRKYMPILATATVDYIGLNTKEEKPLRISEGDETVSFIKQGL